VVKNFWESKIDFHLVKTKSFNMFMTLKEFVRDSLIEIADGVAEARAKNPKISPGVFTIPGDKSNAGVTITTDKHGPAFLIDFDVAVTVSEKTDGGGKAAISVANILAIDGGRSSGLEQSKVSRIQFKVPMVF
jgi:hypothetical protein